MTQEDKKLLLIDLSARQLYGVKLWTKDGIEVLDTIIISNGWINASYDIDEVKPYLRPMSSITEEERTELRKFCETQPQILEDIGVVGKVNSIAVIDFLNSHHLDYRGLIEKDLAIKAPKNMYHILEIIKEDEPINFSKLNDGMYNKDGWITIRDGLKMDREGHIIGGLKLK